MGAMNFSTGHSQRFIKIILDRLAEEPMTTPQLAALLYRSHTSICLYVAHLREAPRRLQIVGWGPSVNGGQKPPIYAPGSGKDAPQPRQRSNKKRVYPPRQPKVIGWPDKALAYLELYPDSTTEQIAAALDAKQTVMTTTLMRLRDKGKVNLTGPGRRGKCWSLVESRTVDDPKQVIKRHWTPIPIKPQGPFSALGL